LVIPRGRHRASTHENSQNRPTAEENAADLRSIGVGWPPLEGDFEKAILIAVLLGPIHIVQHSESPAAAAKAASCRTGR
jgi:hypothetical protein